MKPQKQTIILVLKFDDTFYEPIFRGIWFLTTILWGTLMGTREVVARKNKIGYIYYAGIILLIIVIIIDYISIYTIFK